MLVLTRKHQEKIRIGDHITITVLKTKGKSVRLGIEAPAEVPVIRGELSFTGHAVEWEQQPDGAELEPSRPAVVNESRSNRAQAHWPAKLGSVVSPTRPPGTEPTQVSLQRVPRDEMSQVLPNLMSGGKGPLRTMLDRRSVAT
jgi:carbon storage regulator CsrA